MFEHSNHVKCVGCGNSDCLFKLRVDAYYKKRTGSIRFKTTRWCKLCYLENCRMKNDRNPLTREQLDRINKRNRELYKNPDSWYRRSHDKYIQKNRVQILEKKKEKYVPRKRRKRKWESKSRNKSNHPWRNSKPNTMNESENRKKEQRETVCR